MNDELKQYFSTIGKKGGSVTGKNLGNTNAKKYFTEAERIAARKKSQKDSRIRRAALKNGVTES